MKPFARCLILSALATLPASAAYTLVNGDFEDTSGTFPNGWVGTSTFNAGGFASGSADAGMSSGGSITQDFSGGPTIDTSENYDFQLDFAFRTSAISKTTGQRFRLSSNNSGYIIVSLGFATDATGGGTALSYFNGSSFQTALDVAFTSGTTYYFRVIGSDWDNASRSYTIGYSTDGVNYTTSGSITGFHNAPGGANDFETFRVEAGSTTSRIDAVTVVPEPSVALLGSLSLLGLLRRRR
jgi:hypothetical protein